jgi:diadenylate cyclase
MAPLLLTAFITLRWLDIVDILLVAFLLFQLYSLIKGTGAINIFIGIISIYLVWMLVKAFEMELLSEILGQFISVGVIALIIVFQQEIRQFLLLLGSQGFVKKTGKSFFTFRWQTEKFETEDIDNIVNACDSMAKSKTGALIIVTRKNELRSYVLTGEQIYANISKQLIETIFFKNSPLHDGAMIVSGNKIKAARCVLPVSEKSNLPENVGLRHRAAIGITEESDAIAIVVSEQRGEISIADGAVLKMHIKPEKLKEYLIRELN